MSHHAWGGGCKCHIMHGEEDANVTSCMGRRMQMSHHAWGGGCKCHIMHGDREEPIKLFKGTLYITVYAHVCTDMLNSSLQMCIA